MSAGAAMAQGRRVLITGASSGIGRECALTLVKRGYTVFAGVRNPADGARLRDEAGAALIPVELDVTDEASVARAVERVSAGSADAALQGLVNNAGIAVSGPMEFFPVDELRRVLEINVVGVARVTQRFLPLVRRGSGRVVNISSTAGILAVPFIGAYAASKFGLEGLSDALRQELRPSGLHVAIVEPGNISTPIWDKTEAAANALEPTLPAHALQVYGARIGAARRLVAKARAGASHPRVVARAVEHALTARHPKTRYRVGASALAEGFLSDWVPDRLRDWIIASLFR